MQKSDKSLWKNRNFTLFLAIQTLSAIGDSFTYIALPLLVFYTTGSVVQMGLVTALQGAASIVTGVFAGVLADRFNRRSLLILCDLARCVLFASLPIVWLFRPELWLIYAVVPFAGIFSMIFRVTYVTIVPSLVDADQITAANGQLYGAYAVASVGGPVAAGFISGVFGPSVAIAVDAVSFGIAALGVLLVRTRPAPAADAVAERPSIMQNFLAGAKFLWANPVMRALTVLLSLLTFLTYGLTDLIIYYLKHELHHPDGTVGYVLGAATVGTLIASSLVSRIRKRFGFGATWITANVVAGVATAVVGLTSGIPVIALLVCIVLACTGVGGICSMSLRQEVTPSALLGRVTSTFWTIHAALGPLGAALVTIAAAAYGAAGVFVVIGVASVVIAASGLWTAIAQGHSAVAVEQSA